MIDSKFLTPGKKVQVVLPSSKPQWMAEIALTPPDMGGCQQWWDAIQKLRGKTATIKSAPETGIQIWEESNDGADHRLFVLVEEICNYLCLEWLEADLICSCPLQSLMNLGCRCGALCP